MVKRKKRLLVADLAAETRLPPDEVLLTLWNAGIDYVSNYGDALRRDDQKRAQKVLNVPTRRELTSLAYWEKEFNLPRSDFAKMLQRMGFTVSEGQTKVPKGAVRKLASARRACHTRPIIDEDEIAAKSKHSAPKSFRFEQIGVETTPRLLSFDDIVRIHQSLAADFAQANDPIYPAGVKNETLLRSAITRPQTSLSETYKYRTVETAAAALFHSLVMDHPFHNGNKRTGLVAMLVMLDINGLMLTCTEDELFKLVLQVAQHTIAEAATDQADREVSAIATWIHERCRPVEKGDFILPFRRLRRILTHFGCEIDVVAGSCANIRRTKTTPSGMFGRTRILLLATQIAYYSEGTEVEKNTIAKIRKELHLDDEHNVDSKSFYRTESLPASEFIETYRKTLRRLAKM